MAFLGTKHIYIFLNKKIISCDTILPLMLEIKKRNNSINIHFVIFDFKTYNFIQKNLLLLKIINEVGSMKCLGREYNSNYFKEQSISKYHYKRLNIILHLIKIFSYLLRLFLNLIFYNTIFIHFRALNIWPTKILYYFNKSKTILCEADSSGFSNTIAQVNSTLNGQIQALHDFNLPIPCGNKIIAFSKLFPLLKHPALINSKKYIIESSHNRKIWLNYITSNANSMLQNTHKLDKNSDYCVLVLSHIGQEMKGAKILKNKDSWTTLVEDILDIIYSENPNIIILIKPHIITDMVLLNKILSKRTNIKTMITYLHPALLAVKAKFSIASHYSTAFQSIYYIGGITIEYTDQKEVYRKKLNYKSKRPEFTSYFFNDDENGFRTLLRDINNNKMKVKLKNGYDEDPTNLFNDLSN